MNAQEINVNIQTGRVKASGLWFCDNCEKIYVARLGAEVCCTSVVPKWQSIGSMDDKVSELMKVKNFRSFNLVKLERNQIDASNVER